ncbi:MAG: DUF349 domain-containing protein [Actinomycetia bacterium]|nr:DUF349 domain-containing protein [Actinomycetes bacterium]
MTEHPPEQATPQASAPPPERPRPIPRPGPPPGVPASLGTASSQPWGRVDDAGAVYVRTPDGPEDELKVGEWLAGDPADGVRFYERKYVSLGVEIDLLDNRLGDAGLPQVEVMALIGKLRDQVDRPHCVGDLAALRSRLDDLVAAVDAQRGARKAERAAARERARSVREGLVTEAEKLAESTQWKASGDRFRLVVEEWRTAPHAERSYEQELWKRLSHARSTFEKRRRAWFASRDSERSEAVAVKEKIVKEAEGLAPSKDWGPSSAAFRSLMERWKSAGPATREAEAELWPRFKAAQDTFFTARSAVFDERDAEQLQNLAKKKGLADEAEKLVPITDLNAARTSLRSIQDRWAQIGHVPRADKPAIERRLQQVEQALRSAEETKWKRSNPEARARAAAAVEQLTTSILKLEKQRDAGVAAGKSSDVEKAEAAIAARREWLVQAESTLNEFSE